MTEGRAVSLVDEMRAYIRKQVAAGYLTADEVEEAAIDAFVHDLGGGPPDPAMLQRIAGVETDKAFAVHLDGQREWPEVTDCDRLDQAFSDLNRRGIVARQNFSCCNSCGHAEIGDEIAAVEKSGTRVIGYTFFHFQSTEGAVEYGNLYLAYSGLSDDEVEGVRIGRSVAETLERRGLAVEWNGRFDAAIRVTLDWRRRISRQMAERARRMR